MNEKCCWGVEEVGGNVPEVSLIRSKLKSENFIQWHTEPVFVPLIKNNFGCVRRERRNQPISHLLKTWLRK
jgi:hypothetical protein